MKARYHAVPVFDALLKLSANDARQSRWSRPLKLLGCDDARQLYMIE
jgi:hypothetical protein